MAGDKARIARIADAAIAEGLATCGAVVVEGPMLCGKRAAAAAHCASAVVGRGFFGAGPGEIASMDPADFVEGPGPRLVEEWQLAKGLPEAIAAKGLRKGTGRFVFTGSAKADISRLERAFDEGVRRVRMHTPTLLERGLSSGEVSLAGLMHGLRYEAEGALGGCLLAEAAVRGGWPGAESVPHARPGVGAYLAALPGRSGRTDMPAVDWGKVEAMAAGLAACESTFAANVEVIAQAARLRGEEGRFSDPTRKVYESLLRDAFVVQDVPAWIPSSLFCRIKTGSLKRHLCDTSIVAAALGLTPSALLRDEGVFGRLHESLAIHDLAAYCEPLGGRVLHYRDGRGLSVDAVVELPDGTWASFETSLDESGVERAAAALNLMEARAVSHGVAAPAAKCVVVGFGSDAYMRGDGVQVAPIGTLGV